MKVRELSDGSKLIIPDGNITRKLNAIAKFEQNRVVDGLWVTGHIAGDAYGCIAISEGNVVLGNNYQKVAGVATLAITTGYPTYPFTTVYVASGAAIPTYKSVPSAAAAYYPPGTADITPNMTLLAHIKHTATYVSATQIDNQVRPKIFNDVYTWDKRDWD